MGASAARTRNIHTPATPPGASVLILPENLGGRLPDGPGIRSRTSAVGTNFPPNAFSRKAIFRARGLGRKYLLIGRRRLGSLSYVELLAQALDGDPHQLAARARAQLGKQPLHGALYRALRGFQAAGDLLVCLPLEDASQHGLLQVG